MPTLIPTSVNMKKLILLLTVLVSFVAAFSQSTETDSKIKFRTIIKDRNGVAVLNYNVDLVLSVIQGTALDKPIYAETHKLITDSKGQVVVVVGAGEPFGGDFESIAWEDKVTFIKTEVPALGMLKMSRVSKIVKAPVVVAPPSIHSPQKIEDSLKTPSIKEKAKLAVSVNDSSLKDSLKPVLTPKIAEIDTLSKVKSADVKGVKSRIINLSLPVNTSSPLARKDTLLKDTVKTSRLLTDSVSKVKPLDVKEQIEAVAEKGNAVLPIKDTLLQDTAKAVVISKVEEVDSLPNVILPIVKDAQVGASFQQEDHVELFTTHIKNINGFPYNNAPVVLKLSVLEGSTSGDVVYQETHATKTNDNGEVLLQLGKGANVKGDYTKVDRTKKKYFVRSDVQPTGVVKYDRLDASTLLTKKVKRDIEVDNTVTESVALLDKDTLEARVLIDTPKVKKQQEIKNNIIDLATEKVSTPAEPETTSINPSKDTVLEKAEKVEEVKETIVEISINDTKKLPTDTTLNEVETVTFKAPALEVKKTEIENSDPTSFVGFAKVRDTLAEITPMVDSITPKVNLSVEKDSIMKLNDSAPVLSVLTPDTIEQLSPVRRGELLIEKGKYRKAISILDNAISNGVVDPFLHYNRGLANSKLKQQAYAIADYSQAIDLNPKMGEAYFKRANSKAALKDTRGATQDYLKSISLDKNNKKAHYNLGVMQMQHTNYSEAIYHFDNATVLDNKWGLAFYQKGVAKIKAGLLDSGCIDLSKAGELGFEQAYKAISKKCTQ